MDCKPFLNSTNKIHNNTNKPKAMAIMDKVNPTWLLKRRRL
jgi:hypothetical protein